MSSEYTPTIGLEIHAELKTKTKMFCSCINNPHAAEPNMHICPVCTAQPGALPVVNKQAVENVLKVGVALGATTASFTEFDRKNYFYPDIPKAYQISQYQYPLVTGGELNGVTITRIHLEEDTARSAHDQVEGSVVDFNRAGVPLMELVTEPVIHDAKSASAFAKELQLLLRTLGVSDANMERGEMRVEANISISKTSEFGTKVEVKNLNSFKAVEGAIAYELKRQEEVLEAGGTLVQETRGWDEQKTRTFSQRTKETADDYRYFPDPDITKIEVTKVADFDNSRLSEIMPVLPAEKRALWQNLGVNHDLVEVIVSDSALSNLFTSSLDSTQEQSDIAPLLANYVASDIQSLLSSNADTAVSDQADSALAELMKMVATGDINSRVAKDLLQDVVFSGLDPQKLAEERGLKQLSTPEALTDLAVEIISENGEVVAEVKAGKEAALKFLVGQGMKKSRGTANPAVLESLLREKIGS